MVRDFLAKTHLDIRVRLFEEPILLGSAGTLRANRAWVASEPSFWVFYADILTAADLTRMADFHRHWLSPVLCFVRVGLATVFSPRVIP
jgi:mannose-1-phosphate guanylyltransferase